MPAMIGLDMIHYSIMTKEETASAAATYDTPAPMIGAQDFNVNPNSSEATLFGDNGPMETASTMGTIEVEYGIASLEHAIASKLLGQKLSKNGLLMKGVNDIPPWTAVGGRVKKSNGRFRYFWMLKGKHSVPEFAVTTQKDSIEYQTDTLKYNCVKRNDDGMWMFEWDEESVEDSTIAEKIKDLWFTKVVTAAEIDAITAGGDA